MGVTRLIIGREYLTRVKKRTFIVMTILGPILFAGFFAAVILMSQQEKDKYTVGIFDATYTLSNRMPPMTGKIKWDPVNATSYNDALIKFKSDESFEKYDLLLYLPENIINTERSGGKIIYRKAPSISIEDKIKESVRLARESFIISKQYEGDSAKMKEFRSTYANIRSLNSFSLIDIDNIDEKGEAISKNVDHKVGAGVGMAFSFIIFFFIFFFGAQVMRGVIEEKTNRIIEVIISSVKPFQLMMGKIIGVALVGLTQFVIWGVFSTILINVLMAFIMPDYVEGDAVSQMSQEMMLQNANLSKFQNDIFNALWALPWVNIITSFIFFFLMGYLIYSALFAAIGSAVDNETDTQQFMTPVILPLMLAFYVVAFSAFKNPDSAAMYWLSLFPLTSPVVMLVRVAMGSAELWEVLLAMGLLIITFIGTVWIAAKVYRTGILMYGKKPSYKEIFKWLKY